MSPYRCPGSYELIGLLEDLCSAIHCVLQMHVVLKHEGGTGHETQSISTPGLVLWLLTSNGKR